MRPRPGTRREPVRHADDWLMTYADMITLLLCFFAIFLSISIAKKDVPKQVASVAAVAPPVQPPDFLEDNLPFHGVERADGPTQDATAVTPPKFDEPPAPQKSEPAAPEAPPVAATPAPGATSVAAAASSPVAPQTAAAPAPTPPGPKGDRITILEMSSAAFFDSGSATLSPAGAAILRGELGKLNSDQYEDYEITVEGHTDDTPIRTAQFPSNWELSTARAAAVVHFLLDQGIPARKLRAAGYADTFPKLPNRDADGNPIPENQAQNRRVVIKLEKIDPAERDPGTKLDEVTPAPR
jgi:flagellar motor protein MotB